MNSRLSGRTEEQLLLLSCSETRSSEPAWHAMSLIDVEVDVEEADRKKDEIGQKSAVFMILRRFATGKS